MKRRLVTSFDLVLIALVLCLIFAFGFIKVDSVGKTAVVLINNGEVGRFSLSKDIEKTFKTDDGYNKLVVKNGKCYVENADCRDGICVDRGKISKVGESIVCLPHKFIVEIE